MWITLVVCIAILIAHNSIIASKSKHHDLGEKYSVKVIDDHEVRLTRKGKTITLSLENASVLSEEEVIFVKSN